MDAFAELEKFKSLVLQLELPRHDFALFGVKCPYCGKTDRIHKLEEPDEINGAPAEYGEVWNKYRPKGELSVCTFCRQILALSESRDSAIKLADF